MHKTYTVFHKKTSPYLIAHNFGKCWVGGRFYETRWSHELQWHAKKTHFHTKKNRAFGENCSVDGTFKMRRDGRSLTTSRENWKALQMSMTHSENRRILCCEGFIDEKGGRQNKVTFNVAICIKTKSNLIISSSRKLSFHEHSPKELRSTSTVAGTTSRINAKIKISSI